MSDALARKPVRSALVALALLVVVVASVQSAAAARPKNARVTSRSLPAGIATRFAESAKGARVRIVLYKLRHLGERRVAVNVGIENAGTRLTARIGPAATVNDRRDHTYGSRPGLSPRIAKATLRPGQSVRGYLTFMLRPLAKVSSLGMSPFGDRGTRALFRLREEANGRTTVLPNPKPPTSAKVTSKRLPRGLAVRTAGTPAGARVRIVFYRLRHLSDEQVTVKLGVENAGKRETASIDPAASITDSTGHTFGFRPGVSPRITPASLRPGQSVVGYLTFGFRRAGTVASLNVAPFGQDGSRALFKLREHPNGRTTVLPNPLVPKPARARSKRLPKGIAFRSADSRLGGRVKVVFYELRRPTNRQVGRAPGPGRQFVGIKLGIENVGTAGTVKVDAAAGLTDSAGHSAGSSPGVSPRLGRAALRPGQSVLGYLTFGIARGAKVASVKVAPFGKAGSRVLFKLRERANGRVTVLPNPIPPRLAQPTSRPLPRGPARPAQAKSGARVRVVLSKIFRPSNLLVGTLPSPGRRFVAARVGIRNMASETVALTPTAALTDSLGHTSGFSLRVSPRLGHSSLRPGQSIIGYLTFGIARTAKIASVQVAPFGSGGTRAVFELRAR